MKIRNRFFNSLIQLTELAQQICYNGHAMIPLKHMFSTFNYLDHKHVFSSNGMGKTKPKQGQGKHLPCAANSLYASIVYQGLNWTQKSIQIVRWECADRLGMPGGS